MARFNRKVANPIIRRFAGSVRPLAVVRHRGRRTGRHYETPVVTFRTDDGLVIGVLYGSSSDWVRNVLAADHAEVRYRGQLREYAHPRLLDRQEGLRLLPAAIRDPYRLLGVRHVIRLTGGDS